MDIINRLQLEDDETFVGNEDEGYIVLRKPTSLDAVPIIDPSLINNKYVTVNTNESILRYFNILRNDMNIRYMNGLSMGNDNYCNYCHDNIETDWQYCCHCYRNMCSLCQSETSEEIALKHDAKNYKVRERALNECRSCNRFQKRYWTKSCYYDLQCDVCQSYMNENKPYYSCKDEKLVTYDICMPCYDTNPQAKEDVAKKSMSLKEVNCTAVFKNTHFNSMLYWFPVVDDNEGCSVLVNLNPHDENYKKVCLLSCDNHGRLGYYIIYNKEYTLDTVLQKIKTICDRGTYEYEEMELDREENEKRYYKCVTKTAEIGSQHHSSPIQLLMQDLGMEVYYG